MALTRPRYSSIVDTDYKASCRVVTTTNVTLSGGAPSSYDSISLAVGDRILVAGQSTASQNGIYIVQTLGTGSNGTWTRSPDANANDRVTAGMTTAIEEGTYVGKTWRLTTGNPIVLGTTALTFVDASSGGSSVQGANRNVQYNDIGSMAGASNFLYFKENGNVSVSGNITVNAVRTATGLYWSSNGAQITGITYTASSTPPAGPNKGDKWYDTDDDVLYEYSFDGVTAYWIDVSSSFVSGNVDTTVVDSINSNIGAFYTYANTKIGTNTNNSIIASNIISTGSGVFRGPYDENSILSGVFVGNTGTAPGVTPRVGFFNGNTQQNWQIDNNAGEFRWFVPGTTRLSLYPNGNLNVVGSLTVGGKKAVNGPAFSAYAAATLQTITSGSQQKVLFQTEEFDTDNCYANSRFTPTVEGYYQLNAEVRLDGASGTGEMMIVIWKNGAEHKRGINQQGTQIAANFWAMQVSSLVYANGTTDFFEIYVQQGSGSSVTVTAVNSPNITWFNGAMVRGA